MSTFVHSPPLSRVTNTSKQMIELTNITQSVEIEDNPNFVHSERDGIILSNFIKKGSPTCF